MEIQEYILLLVLAGVSIVQCQNPPVMHARNSRLKSKDHIHDQNHIKEHYEGVVDMNQETKMSDEETQFHYFKIHDYDSNNKLDGIELISALTHFHKEEDPDNQKPLSDEDISSLVDTILQEDDINKDGYVDYSEFILSQRNDV